MPIPFGANWLWRLWRERVYACTPPLPQAQPLQVPCLAYEKCNQLYKKSEFSWKDSECSAVSWNQLSSHWARGPTWRTNYRVNSGAELEKKRPRRIWIQGSPASKELSTLVTSLLLLFWVILEIGPYGPGMLSKCCTRELHPALGFLFFYNF